ncbi:MAG TPA: 4'-phosphopantetheinyl transferase superfamily protein [Lacunisphaera sp.]|jgi:4'-phosphopantetheinyl transferase|nr:4'-phosphopantetheinyl transferase superfamily protein [Lacunisphaera sp.]
MNTLAEPSPPEFFWSIPEDFPAPGTDDILVWSAWLDDAAGEPTEILSADERARARSFHYQVDRRRFEAAHVVLRQLLGRCAGVDPATLVFATGRFGKPGLASPGGTDLRFNLAHAGPLALVAVARGRAVGVDVEHVRDFVDLALLERQLFPEIALAFHQPFPAVRRRDEFFRRWTEHEAVAKLHGTGLGATPDDPQPSRGEVLDPAGGFIGHLAYEGAPARISRHRWPGARGFGAVLAPGATAA